VWPWTAGRAEQQSPKVPVERMRASWTRARGRRRGGKQESADEPAGTCEAQSAGGDGGREAFSPSFLRPRGAGAQSPGLITRWRRGGAIC